jgi:spore photoproduct lyase
VEKPNQTHPDYITYDIGCNTDVALHAKEMNWQTVFEFFRDHPLAMGSFATKYVNRDLLDFNPDGKIRIRFSLMPDVWAKILEPNTSPIPERMGVINAFIEAGYDVHVNFSPVIYHEGWLQHYEKLFRDLDNLVKKEHKSKVKAEVIFLTHNLDKHQYNLDNNLPGEELLWKPGIQEEKISQYGGTNLRYNHKLKAKLIKDWTELHDEIIPWNTIRYCFTFLLLLSKII